MVLSKKNKGDKLTAAEYNEVVDMIELGNDSIKTSEATVTGLLDGEVVFADANNKLEGVPEFKWDNTAKKLTISGDLDVDGTVTNINELDVDDATITINKGGTTAGADDTAGIFVEGDAAATVGALRFDNNAASKWTAGDGTTQVELVDLSSTQTLTNKTLTSPTVGTDITLDQTTADYTVSWSDPGAARTLTIPDPGANDSFVFEAATQTLTNKTLSAPTLSGTTSGTYTLGGTPTLGSSLTVDTAAGTNAILTESGIDRSSTSVETFNVQNSGTGSITLQQDGTAVVLETRTLTGGDGINALGDLSTDRTISVDIVASDGLQFVAGELTVDEANIDHDTLLNFVANEHVDHSTVTVTAGAGLTGGGDITASRTLDVVGGTGITANANDVAVDTAAALTWTGLITADAGLTLNDGDALTFGTDGDITASWDNVGGELDIVGPDDAAATIHFQAGADTVAAGVPSLDLNFNADNIGFFGATPVAQQTAPQNITFATGVDQTTDGEIEAIGDTSAADQSAVIERNLVEIAEEVNQIRTVLNNLGLTA